MAYVTRVRTPVVLLSLLALTLGLAHPGLAQETPAQPRVTTVAAPPDVAAPPTDAQKTASGLYWKILQPGTGSERPTPADRVTVNYTGWTAEGTMFDSTAARGVPSHFILNRVLPGWTEGVQLMVAGEKRRFWVPEKLAFNGAAGRPTGTLCFDIELLSFVSAPKAPPDVSSPPSDAEKTRSGLVSKVLKTGTGTKHPAKNSTVTVHYSGWTTDGKLFDTSVMTEPATFPLGQVIAGWTEGVQLMVEGETRRFWIPEKLAYGGQEGRPKGMLVFDVELITIQ
jgi:FKBP-type peptidyl-prolyl cis-trans isomerase